jgi:hypothetical protein
MTEQRPEARRTATRRMASATTPSLARLNGKPAAWIGTNHKGSARDSATTASATATKPATIAWRRVDI